MPAFRRTFLAPALLPLFLLLAAAAAVPAQAPTPVPPIAPSTPGVGTGQTPGGAGLDGAGLDGVGLDGGAMDRSVDPCTDFYRYACGHFAAQHPIPADRAGAGQFQILYDANLKKLSGILQQYAAADPSRTANQQKIGDDYAACLNTSLIEQRGLAPVQPLLTEIDHVTKPGLAYFAGELQRYGVTALFNFGEEQDFKDSTKQVAVVDQGGLGLPERDYYTRTGEHDRKLREQYAEHVAKILVALGEAPEAAATDAQGVLAFETKLAEASLTVTEQRDPEAVYHPQTLAQFEGEIRPVPFDAFLQAIHSPAIPTVVNASPKFFPAMVRAVMATDLRTLRAYLRYGVATAYARTLPARIDEENFHFYSTVLYGQTQQRTRPERCAAAVDKNLGEALGQVFVQQYFPADSKKSTLEMVGDIESAMDRDLDTLDWMSPATRVKAKEKLHLVANKIGYPEHWRDYSGLRISPDDAFGNLERATAFENDRELAKIGKPADRGEWITTAPTVNAFYNPSMNDMNFPAGILQPVFYDPKADLAVNYGHIGAIIGHELTHGFDDEGRKFNGQGNMVDWWTAEDTQRFAARTGCLVKEYGSFTAVDDLKINGQLTLGENTADNGGLLLAYMAYLERAKKDGIDPAAKLDGLSGPQRFYTAWAQNWCVNQRPEAVRKQVQTDPHSPSPLRANGVVVNQPGFAGAFGCKRGSAMAPVESCRVW